MSAGEYVSVSSQTDVEKADIEREQQELNEIPEIELQRLAEIYEKRGLKKETALAVAKELSEKHKSHVIPFAFIVNGENVIGYLKEPGRLIKMQAIDMRETSRTQAGDLILRSCLIQEESDKRILEERPENDAIYLGAIDFAINTVMIYQ